MTTTPTDNAFAGLEPKAVWGFFAGIAAVPRPSKREEQIRKHVRDVAQRLGLHADEDATGNILIKVPASKGKERAPVTVLQAHVDMVCEKNSGTKHDFDREGIYPVIETEGASGERIVKAKGTTLGADNGIGVSMALASATSPEVVHGPLELLFTVDEEDGMTGAKNLRPGFFQGKRMLNLDSEEDDSLYIGCAGGCDTNLTWNHAMGAVTAGAECVRVAVSGLRGGHSGVEIHEGRANAIKLLVRTLTRAGGDALQLISIQGGSKRNAIPREAVAVVAGPAGLLESLKKPATEVAREGKEESFEPQVSITAERAESGSVASVDKARTRELLLALSALPSGVLGMHPRVAGLVETSNNLSTINSTTSGAKLTVQAGLLSRSSSGSRMSETLAQIAAIGRLTGAEIATGNQYPGWSPNPDSPLLGVARRVYKDLFEAEPKVAAIHAGLECGIIGERMGGIDTISLGPTIKGAHSPDERVYIESVGKSWRYLTALLEALSKG
jgi:dipeptidase D